MSFGLSNFLFNTYTNDLKTLQYLQNVSNDVMDTYQSRVGPNIFTGSVREQAIKDWEQEKLRRFWEGNTAERNAIQREAEVANAYVPSKVPLNFKDPYSLIDRNTGRIIPLADAQAGGISPAQYYVATEMLKKRGYRGF
jgi:hypothetical protein